ncbi:MAG: glycosyl hydrolase [Candidatus Omnitrophota bacterium]
MKKKNFISLSVLIFIFSVTHARADGFQKSKFVPPEGNVLVFVGQDKDTIDKYHKAVGITPAGVMVYTSIQKMDGLYAPADYGSGDQHMQWLIEQFPDSAIQIGLYMVGALDMVTAGAFDDHIVKLAKFFNDHDCPFYLRIGYEFDSPLNDYAPGKYIEAYRYIVNHLRDQGVDNVAYVWHAHGPIYDRPQMDWYPGDDFVDWVGVSYFSPYNTDGLQRIADLCKSLNKPLMLAESTPIKLETKNGEDTWKRWYRFVFKHIDDYNVKAFCYINSYWDSMPMWAKDKWGDARVEENEYIKEKWIEAMNDQKFLHGHDGLFGALGYSKKGANP